MRRSGDERTTRAAQDVIIGAVHHLVFTDEEMLKRLKAGGYHAFMALEHFKKLIARREVELLLGARSRGWAWHYIAALLGKSPQAVQQRWKRLTRDWD
jgi:hypothetical protein